MLKNIQLILCFCTFLFTNFITAQEISQCGTKSITPNFTKSIAQLPRTQRQIRKRMDEIKQKGLEQLDEKIIPIHIIDIRNEDQNSPTVSIFNIQDAINKSNKLLRKVKLSLQFTGEITYVKDDKLLLANAPQKGFDPTPSNILAVQNTYGKADKLNLIIVPSFKQKINKDGKTVHNSIGGIASVGSFQEGSFLVCRPIFFEKTNGFIHELGHYLSLLHIEETTFKFSKVDGSDCKFTGDLICDTPAAPDFKIANINTDTCVYTTTEKDTNGTLYKPDFSNLMNPSPIIACIDPTGFTNEQLVRIRAGFEISRNHLSYKNEELKKDIFDLYNASIPDTRTACSIKSNNISLEFNSDGLGNTMVRIDTDPKTAKNIDFATMLIDAPELLGQQENFSELDFSENPLTPQKFKFNPSNNYTISLFIEFSNGDLFNIKEYYIPRFCDQESAQKFACNEFGITKSNKKAIVYKKATPSIGNKKGYQLCVDNDCKKATLKNGYYQRSFSGKVDTFYTIEFRTKKAKSIAYSICKLDKNACVLDTFEESTKNKASFNDLATTTEQTIDVFYNKTNTAIEVITDAKDISVNVYDLLGRKQLHTTTKENVIDATPLAKGVFIVTLVQNGVVINTHKFVK